MSKQAIKSTHTIERDENGYSTSITWTYKKYNNFSEEVQTKVIDAEGTTQDVTVNVVDEDDLVITKSITFNIPEHLRTTAVHEEPHVYEREMELQSHLIAWHNLLLETEEGQQFFAMLSTA